MAYGLPIVDNLTADPKEDFQEPPEDSLNEQVNAWLQRQYQGVCLLVHAQGGISLYVICTTMATTPYLSSTMATTMA